jgi:hypothetical protein
MPDASATPRSGFRAPRSRGRACLAKEATAFAVYLQTHCRGRAAAQPKRTILPALLAAGIEISARDYDKLASVACGMGLHVGTCGKGAFWVCDEADQAAAEGNILPRFNPMRVHLEHLQRLGRERFGKQPLLETAAHAENAEYAEANHD